jgi:hypothetical protein
LHKNINNACFIHIRRDDYLNSTYDLDLIKKNYYNNQIEEFLKKDKNTYFYVFSDDNIWCKEYFKDRINFEVVEENDEFVWVKGNAGEVWHEFVQYCIKHNYGGIENLSLIPVLGVLSCMYLLTSMNIHNWIYFMVWMVIGLVAYFSYGIKKSKLNPKNQIN